MENRKDLPFITLLLMISFASVNAVMFTPALPDIAKFFQITHDSAELTISIYLIGYALGQLLYGPLANRFGRKPALFIGIFIQLASSALCVLSGYLHSFDLLVVGRLLLALGSGVGLKMAFTLVNECYEPKAATKKVSYLILSFAVTPGLSAALGGFLNHHFGWVSCFYAGILYGLVLFGFSLKLPETLTTPDLDALKLEPLIQHYGSQFKNKRLLIGAAIMGLSTCFVYSFAAIAPFVAIDNLGLSSAEYGIANIIPSIGLFIGSLISAKLSESYSPGFMIRSGILLASIAVLIMFFAVWRHASAINSVFIPMMLVYLGLSGVLANASSIAMSTVDDKAHGSAVMNFINMGLATVVVLSLSLLPSGLYLMPSLFLAFIIGMYALYKLSEVTK